MISTALRLRAATAGAAPPAPLAEFGAGMAEALRARWPALGNGAVRWRGVVDAPQPQ